MSVSLGNLVPSLLPPPGFLDKLAQAMIPAKPIPGKAAPVSAAEVAGQETPLTPNALRAALLEIGASANAENIALAQSLAQLGLPLSASMLGEAHGALARAPGASPSSFALAKSLNLVPTPAILRALTAVTDGIPAERALPAEISEWLGLHLDAGETDADTLAAQVHLMVNARAHSLENRLLSTPEGENMHDARAMLLRLAHNSLDRQTQRGADTLAAHMEGQQLVNGAARQADARAPLYFALPMSLPGEALMLELKLWEQDDARDWAHETDDAELMRAVVRLATTRLGRVQVELSGTLAGRISCRIGAEKPAAVRLFTRHKEMLSTSFAALGWPSCLVSCTAQTDWPPLWHGGPQLAAPRVRVDWRA